MPFLVDGYNLMHAMGLLSGRVGPHGLTKARASLLGRISTAHAASPGDVTVVFDGRKAPAGVNVEDQHKGVHVEYALSEEADDRIEWLIAHDPAPKRLVVVSDDRRLQLAAQKRGCSWWKCSQYLDWLDKLMRERRRVPPSNEKPSAVGPVETDRWLDAFADVQSDPAWDELFGPFDNDSGT